MPAWLRAGLIGAGILIILDLIGLIPFIGCVTIPFTLLAYALIGAMAASYLPPMREVSAATGQGALAASLAALGGGLVSLLIAAIQASSGSMAQVLAQLPPELRRQLLESGIDPNLFLGPVGATIGGGMCCTIGILFAAVLGAVGGAIYASSKPK
jgi:hypothetical protein